MSKYFATDTFTAISETEGTIQNISGHPIEVNTNKTGDGYILQSKRTFFWNNRKIYIKKGDDTREPIEIRAISVIGVEGRSSCECGSSEAVTIPGGDISYATDRETRQMLLETWGIQAYYDAYGKEDLIDLIGQEAYDNAIYKGEIVET